MTPTIKTQSKLIETFKTQRKVINTYKYNKTLIKLKQCEIKEMEIKNNFKVLR